MRIEMATEYGSLEIEREQVFGKNYVVISTKNYPEGEQEATLTRENFIAFIEECQKILAELPEE